ncbi:hypothetical protein KKG36_00705 [Patescibacteria group bacterium]|nr:hypothetical protein [Patescibacteria group bacterium]
MRIWLKQGSDIQERMGFKVAQQGPFWYVECGSVFDPTNIHVCTPDLWVWDVPQEHIWFVTERMEVHPRRLPDGLYVKIEANHINSKALVITDLASSGVHFQRLLARASHPMILHDFILEILTGVIPPACVFAFTSKK